MVILIAAGFGGILGFSIAISFGILATVKHSQLVQSGQGGLWKIFTAIAVLVFIITALFGYSCLPVQSSGEPSEQFYYDVFYSFIFFGASPGFGLIAGAWAAKYKY